MPSQKNVDDTDHRHPTMIDAHKRLDRMREEIVLYVVSPFGTTDTKF